MISVKEACKLVTEERGEPFVEVITDIGHSYVIGTVGANGETAEVPPCMVDKINGEVGVCFVPNYIEELKAGRVIAVPREYKAQ